MLWQRFGSLWKATVEARGWPSEALLGSADRVVSEVCWPRLEQRGLSCFTGAMAADKSAERPPATVRDFRLLQVLLLCLLLLGPVFIVTGIHSNYRDRHSLK